MRKVSMVSNLLLALVIVALALAVAYVVGTFPSADIAAHLATSGKGDIRAMGTGNPGAANVMGELGKGWGAFVLVLDITKGVVACLAGRWLAGDAASSLCGTAAVIGHCFPLWNGFRGGKGVATAGGQMASTFPAIIPVAFIAAAVFRRFRSRVYGVVCAVWVAGAALWWATGWPNGWGPEPDTALLVGAAASTAVIAYRFRTAAESEAKLGAA